MPAATLPINKKVQLHCQEGHVFTGFVYTIDPVSGNYVLFREEATRLVPTIVCGWAVERVEVLPDELTPDLRVLFQALSDKYGEGKLTGFTRALSRLPTELSRVVDHGPLSAADIEQRRLNVISLFQSHQIDVTQSSPSEPDLLSIGNLVFIRPPYIPSSCTGHNLMVLDRVRGMLAGLPAFELEASSNDEQPTASTFPE